MYWNASDLYQVADSRPRCRKGINFQFKVSTEVLSVEWDGKMVVTTGEA
jgi:hypothetical protein